MKPPPIHDHDSARCSPFLYVPSVSKVPGPRSLRGLNRIRIIKPISCLVRKDNYSWIFHSVESEFWCMMTFFPVCSEWSVVLFNWYPPRILTRSQASDFAVIATFNRVHTKNETKSWDGKRLARSMQIMKCFVFRRQTSEAKQKQIQMAGPLEPVANNLLRLLSFLYGY